MIASLTQRPLGDPVTRGTGTDGSLSQCTFDGLAKRILERNPLNFRQKLFLFTDNRLPVLTLCSPWADLLSSRYKVSIPLYPCYKSLFPVAVKIRLYSQSDWLRSGQYNTVLPAKLLIRITNVLYDQTHFNYNKKHQL